MIVYIKGEKDILSNFYPCKLMYNGEIFNSAEHLYQSWKCLFHNNLKIDQEIRVARDGKTAKIISKKIIVSKEWDDIRPLVMAEILKLKFLQCEKFRKTLMNSSGYLSHNVHSWGISVIYWGISVN